MPTGIFIIKIFLKGAGKSLCYQMSALNLEGLTIVVSPLIALVNKKIIKKSR